jgi:outer membrane receptor protein involved in Fe transport
MTAASGKPASRAESSRTVPAPPTNQGYSLIAGAISMALYAAAPHAQAQQVSAQQSKDDLTLEEVVVTATLRRTSVQDVPQSITVIGTDQIEKSGFKEMGDYLKALPSVTLAQLQPGRNDIIFRGVATDTEDFYGDAQAGVYLDDQPITTNATQVSPYLVDIERVEALPGPQGTLFGSSAETGVLRIITSKPDFKGFSGQYSVTGTSTRGGAGSYEADGHLNIPLIDNKLSARLVGFYSDSGGWIDNVAGPDLATAACSGPSSPSPYCTLPYPGHYSTAKPNFNEWKVSGGRLAALWKVSDRADVLFNVTAQNDQTHGDWLSDPYLGDAKITRFIEGMRHDNWWQSAVTVTADLGFAELKSASAYFARHMTYLTDNMTYEQFKAAYYGSDAYGAPKYNRYDTRLTSDNSFTTSTIFNDQWQYRFSQELRLTSKGTSRLQWIGGLFFERVHDNWVYGTDNSQFMNTYGWQAAQAMACDPATVGAICPLPPTTIVYIDYFDRVVKQTAAFGELSYKLADPWTVTVGGRWFKYDRSVNQSYEIPLGIPVGPASDNAKAGSDSARLFKVGTQYKYNKDGMLYALFSQGYRLGGYNSARAAASGTVPLKYKPDKLANLEFGLKSQWLDRRLTLNVSAFLMKWNDIQLESRHAGDTPGSSQWWIRGTINGGTAETKGIEISGAARATRHLSLDFNLTAANPKLTEDVHYPNGDVVAAGTMMVGAPKFKASLGMEYTFPWKPMGGDLWARFEYSHQSYEYQSLARAEEHGLRGRVQPWDFGKFLLGLDLPSKTELSLKVDNVWNSRGSNWISLGEEDNADVFGDPRYHNLQARFRPQNISLTLRKNF